MNKPSLDHLMERVDSKYTLVVLAAKRARELMDHAQPMITTTKSMKPVSIALREIEEGKLNYEQPQGGLK
ncbi:DNA-directed RNA polymerase subunit omega [Heliophilum fasciatum]|uniref:DNA-directed RNA polymerase subunit omega n=1 Tax=Heliophilum fasciatum TaxID=35700 RepID=A0A4R2RUV6_9FIRM|nr:DNA-directed RNA polymerase subunit omega [Heliophilum fasciatum]MCW2277213.1 DNA-directed RNA polymerase subunit omega [Heliophilum fasciatum]TCP68152.1 DNA-directed RNA polymerase subunit omega [Heliophilum fasciatum]